MRNVPEHAAKGFATQLEDAHSSADALAPLKGHHKDARTGECERLLSPSALTDFYSRYQAVATSVVAPGRVQGRTGRPVAASHQR